MSSRRSRRGRRLLGAGLAVLVVAGGAAGYLLVFRDSGSSSAGQPRYTLAQARRGELRETVDAQFTMARSTQTQLRAPAAGTITRLDLAEGEGLPTLKPLLEVDGTTIYGIASATPFYRDLADGDSGDDVKALQSALKGAGHDPGTIDGDFGGGTVTALEDWQDAQGLDVTGRLPLASFVSFPPGSIVLDLPISVGGRLAAGTSMATVGGSRDMVAKADVAQADVVRLKVGQSAGLTLDAMSGTTVPAKVASIALDANAQTQSAGTSAPVEYSVELTPVRLPSSVRAGMTGQVSVSVVDLRNAVIVPTAAVGGSADDPTVQVMSNGAPVTVPVVVGLATSSGVQILTGIQPGQTVITGVQGAATATTTGQGGLPGGGFPGGFFGGGRGAGAGAGGGQRGQGGGQQVQR